MWANHLCRTGAAWVGPDFGGKNVAHIVDPLNRDAARPDACGATAIESLSPRSADRTDGRRRLAESSHASRDMAGKRTTDAFA